MTEPDRPGLIGRAAGALTGRVVETIPPEVILDHIDLDALLDRIDLNRVLDRVDINRLLARVDMETLLRDVDIEELVRRSGVPDIVAESTGRLAEGALDLVRRQLVGLDTILIGVVDTAFRRSGGFATAPPALRSVEDGRDPQTVSGNYAGPIGRLLAFAADAALMFVLFTLGVAGVDKMLGIFFDTTLEGRGDSWWALLAAIIWVFTYVILTTAISGRTPGKAIIGLRVVTKLGSTVTPGRVVVRTAFLPVAAAPFGLGLVPIVTGRTRRGLQDWVAGTAVVYDWGDRPAQMPGPLSAYISRRS